MPLVLHISKNNNPGKIIMFSALDHRFNSATPEFKRALLREFVAWITNVCDANSVQKVSSFLEILRLITYWSINPEEYDDELHKQLDKLNKKKQELCEGIRKKFYNLTLQDETYGCILDIFGPYNEIAYALLKVALLPSPSNPVYLTRTIWNVLLLCGVTYDSHGWDNMVNNLNRTMNAVKEKDKKDNSIPLVTSRKFIGLHFSERETPGIAAIYKTTYSDKREVIEYGEIVPAKDFYAPYLAAKTLTQDLAYLCKEADKIKNINEFDWVNGAPIFKENVKIEIVKRI